MTVIALSAVSLLAQTPSVNSTSPTPNAINVPLNASVSIDFTGSIDSNTFNANTFVVHGAYTGRLSGTYVYNSDANIATFTPDQPFKAGEQVSVTATQGLGSQEWGQLLSPYTWNFTAEVLGGSGTFAAVLKYDVEKWPTSLAAADLDGDGDTDLAVANVGSITVSVLPNNGDGTFAAKTDYAIGSNPRSIFAADLDGDGDADLVTANNITDTDNSIRDSVSVLLNYGSGTFAPAVNFGVGDEPTSIAAADLDGDGDIDLAVTNSISADVSVLLNSGNGTYAAAVNYDVGTDPGSVTTADLDGDGDIDMVVANRGSNSISVLLGNGDGTFAPRVDYGAGTTPWSVTAADLDGNGYYDLAVANYSSNSVSVLLGAGDGAFAGAVNYAVGSNPYSVIAADLDGEGILDLAVANSNSGNVSVLLGVGDGTFAGAKNFAVGGIPVSVSAADVDTDGDLDLVVANFDDNSVSVLLNEGGFSSSLSSLGSEVSGDVPLEYHVSQPSGVLVNLDVVYSINSGASWAVPTIVGDTTSLGPANYDGTLIWQTEADHPGEDLPNVQLRITPYTAESRGNSFTTPPFRLDNNRIPAVSLAPLTGKQGGGDNTGLHFIGRRK
ncbi:MAG: VCBS repeat-containing protein [Candidatus Marinimicrobia bacterium]|nr:VCBS repeat-containing protein [Candidatus Neomarinimicrobiota bacterium]